jgi:hypothetical protein
MHNLENREFSLRRYCRSSGREVCHYVRKRIESKIPGSGSGTISGIHQALSNIRRRASSIVALISSFRRHSSSTRGSVASSRGTISSRLSSSRYNSISSRTDHDESDDDSLIRDESTVDFSFVSRTIRIEFSNYARIDIKCRGSTSSKKIRI